MYNPPVGCFADGEASLAVRKELAAGPVNVSLVGYTLSYNTLDNNKLPTSGLYAELKQDFAGVGGDVNFIRTQVEARKYYEVFSDVVSVLKLQAGNISGWGGKDLRMLDHFQMGPNLVRGFSPAGIGPRDLTPGTTNDALGGSCIGARASRRRRRCISCQKMSASSSRLLRMPAPSGATRADQLECDGRNAFRLVSTAPR